MKASGHGTAGPAGFFKSELRAQDGERAALTKRKVIGTIENIRLPALPGLARVCVRSRTHIGLVAERQVNIRPAFKDSKLLPFGLYFPFLSPSLIPPTLSIPRPSTPCGYQPIYSWRRSVAPICRCSPSAALRVHPRRVTLSRPSIKFERQL